MLCVRTSYPLVDLFKMTDTYPVDLLGCPANVLEVEPRRWIWGVGLFMLAQVGILALQDAIGPAFFLPKSLNATAPVYDYHPPLTAPADAEAGGKTLGDCAICMDAIVAEEGDGEEDEDGGGTTVAGAIVGRAKKARARKGYALAPCHHLFVSATPCAWERLS
jgi:transmembrane E3 ubiquitin-protein ligase